MRRVHAAAACVLSGLALLAAVAPVGAPAQSGVWDAKDRGCYCHSQDANPAVGFTVTGLVGRYVGGANYTLVITVTYTDVPPTAGKPQGGFHIEASSGTFSVPPGWEGLVQVNGAQATHTVNGTLRRDWAVNWTAPANASQAVTFYIFVNTVNGNKSETLGTDHWTSKTIQIGVGDDPVVTGPPAPKPPFAFETYAVLAFGAIFAAFALYTFRKSATKVGGDIPDNRSGKPPRRRRGGK